MSKLTKLSILLTVVLMLSISGIALAQEGRIQETDEPGAKDVIIAPGPEETGETLALEEVALDETVEAADLGVAEPRLLPDSKFYFLKSWGRSIRSVFTFNKVKKAELKLKFASEKLLELRKLANKEKRAEILEKASEKYKEEIGKLKQAADKIKEKASENPNVAEFLDKFTQKTILQEKVHTGILQKLEGKVTVGKFSQEVFDKIKVNTESHLEKFGEVIQKLENKEQIKARLEKNIKAIKGSVFKPIKDMQILKRIEEKAPEAIKEQIMEVRAERLEAFKEKVEEMKPAVQEKLQYYMEKVQGVEETKMEIIEDIKVELKARPEIREKLEGVKIKIIERVREKVEGKTGIQCPIMVRSLPCKGRMIVEKDASGCPIPKCIELGEETAPAPELVKPTEEPTAERPTTVKPRRVCISLWDPVCGVNGKTYSNKCWADVAGVEIAHKGVCKDIDWKPIPMPIPSPEKPIPSPTSPETPITDENIDWKPLPMPERTSPGKGSSLPGPPIREVEVDADTDSGSSPSVEEKPAPGPVPDEESTEE